MEKIIDNYDREINKKEKIAYFRAFILLILTLFFLKIIIKNNYIDYYND